MTLLLSYDGIIIAEQIINGVPVNPLNPPLDDVEHIRRCIATVPKEAITIITEGIDLTIFRPTARVVERRPFPLCIHVVPWAWHRDNPPAQIR